MLLLASSFCQPCPASAGVSLTLLVTLWRRKEHGHLDKGTIWAVSFQLDFSRWGGKLLLLFRGITVLDQMSLMVLLEHYDNTRYQQLLQLSCEDSWFYNEGRCRKFPGRCRELTGAVMGLQDISSSQQDPLQLLIMVWWRWHRLWLRRAFIEFLLDRSTKTREHLFRETTAPKTAGNTSPKPAGNQKNYL